MTDYNFDKIITKFLMGLGEIVLIIVYTICSFFAGIFLFLIRKYIYKILNWVGISYFNERHTNIRCINSDLIWCQGSLQADSYGLFRTYNGKSYVVDNLFNPHDTGKKKIDLLQKIYVEKVNSKPEDFYDEFIDVEIYESILKSTLTNDWKVFSYDQLRATNSNSPILVFLEENGIDYLMTYRIWDKENKTYGLIFFTWAREPENEISLTREVSKKLDSISIRFQSHINTSVLEKFMRATI